MIYFLFIMLLFFLAFVLFYDKSFFSPAAILCESYLLAVICAIFNIDAWMIQLSDKTVFIILYGCLLFILTSFVIKNLFYKDQKNLEKEKKLLKINLDKRNVLLVLFLQFIIFIIYFYSFYKVVDGFHDFTTLSQKINQYRVSSSFDIGNTPTIPTMVTQLLKISKCFAYISLYILLHNSVYKKCNKIKEKIEKKYLLSILLYLPLTLLVGARIECAVFLLSGIVIWSVLEQVYNKKVSFSMKKAFQLIGIILFCFYFLSVSADLIGRTGKNNSFDYITRYFGGSIQNLDLYFKDPVAKSNVWGKETFIGLNTMKNKILGKEETYSVHLEFRASNGVALGNVYTAYRNMYQDFGFLGMTLLQIISAAFFTWYYEKLKRKNYRNQISISLLFFAMCMHGLFFHSFSEQFYNSVFSINYMTLLLLFPICKYILVKIKFGRSYYGKNNAFDK